MCVCLNKLAWFVATLRKCLHSTRLTSRNFHWLRGSEFFLFLRRIRVLSLVLSLSGGHCESFEHERDSRPISWLPLTAVPRIDFPLGYRDTMYIYGFAQYSRLGLSPRAPARIRVRRSSPIGRRRPTPARPIFEELIGDAETRRDLSCLREKFRVLKVWQWFNTFQMMRNSGLQIWIPYKIFVWLWKIFL